MNYKLIDMAVHGDNRGKLVSLEGNKNIPFEIKRTKFYVNYDDYSQSIVNYNDVFELKKMNFEGFSFYVPNNYDKILKRMYGDYMVLPSKDERVSHGIIKYDFGRYYE